MLLLGLGLFWAAAPLQAQVATAPLDPSQSALNPAATAWRHLDDSGAPKDQTSLGASLLQQGGTAGDDITDWSASNEAVFASFALGPVRFEPRGGQHRADIIWIKAGSHCGQLEGIYNCSYQTAGKSSHQSAKASSLDASLYWGPIAIGAGWRQKFSQIESENSLQENIQTGGISWQLAGPLYVAGAYAEVMRQRSGQTNSFSRQWAAVALRTDNLRFEYAQGSAPEAQTNSDLQLMHPQEEQRRIEGELKIGRFGLSLYQSTTEFAALAEEYQVERGTELRRLALSWVPQRGFWIAYGYRDEIYRMASGSDQTEEGTAQSLSLGLVF